MNILAAACLAAMGMVATAEEIPPADGPVIGLVRVGALDDAMLERVRSFVENKLMIRTRVLDSRDPSGGTLNDEGAALADLAGPGVLCLVALISPEQAADAHGILLPELNIGVVNVPVLKPADDDQERFGRRLERQAMRAIGLLLGMELCPNPYCALRSYRDAAEMDATSRDMCPPCTARAQAAAVAKGAVLIEREYPLPVK
ncbi:MAG: hypothetical protein JXB04_05185 [Kiritimatiellae bacterium]|nr:hypothetical protein [Kiritimatiellia bacterium]